MCVCVMLNIIRYVWANHCGSVQKIHSCYSLIECYVTATRHKDRISNLQCSLMGCRVRLDSPGFKMHGIELALILTFSKDFKSGTLGTRL